VLWSIWVIYVVLCLGGWATDLVYVVDCGFLVDGPYGYFILILLLLFFFGSAMMALPAFFLSRCSWFGRAGILLAGILPLLIHIAKSLW
jgi:hypothetical protein